MQKVRLCEEVSTVNFETCIMRPLNAKYAAEISQWEYPAPYEAYSFKGHPNEYLMDETTWGTEQFALCSGDSLVGQVAGQFYEDRFWVGWSLSPALCGSGNGWLFVRKCVEEIRKSLNFNGNILLRVAASNVRARKAYQKAGFVHTETIQDEVAYSDYTEDFWVMEV